MALGNGTRFVRHDGGEPGVLVDIAHIAVELGSFSLSRDTQENTYYSSESAYKSFAGGARDAGESTIKLEFDRVEGYHLLMLEDFNSDELSVYGFQWPDVEKTQVTCKGIVTGFEVTHAVAEKIFANCTIKWSGEPSWENWV